MIRFMNDTSKFSAAEVVEATYQTDARRVFASLVRLLRDFDLAEEAMHESFAAALERWPQEGVPKNPRAWLVSTGRFQAIDTLRRRGRFSELVPDVAARVKSIEEQNTETANQEIEDDRLRLIFTCCHPAIDPQVQVPLTLREVCGLTTDEIARAFLTAPATMAQRIVRGKAKIRDAGIPFAIPASASFAERLESVLSVIYLVFNEGYSASSGESVTRADLSGEAIRLGRLLVELLPDPEATGLLALMLLQESRRPARSNIDGDIILLEDQNRTLWNVETIREGQLLVEQALSSRRIGAYTIQAAIAAVHSQAQAASETDWRQIVALYDALLSINSSPVVELNRAVAVAMRDGSEAGLNLIDAILQRGDLVDYHLAHAAQAELCRRAGDVRGAMAAYQRAISLVRQEPERRFLVRRLAELSADESTS